MKYVLWDTRIENQTFARWFPSYQPRPEEELPLEQYLKRNYHVLGVKNGFRILERRAAVATPPARQPPSQAPPGHD